MAVLEDITVVEVGDGPAVGFCGKLLASAGARVIKIEPPGGDPSRFDGPRGRIEDGERAPLFMHLHGGKESLALDLETPAGIEVLGRLAGRADVLLESLPAGTLEALGLGYERLRAAHPELVLASITPYGQTGPNRDYVATDITLFASSGAMYREGLPEREPLRYGGHIPRTFPGNVAAGLIMAALFRRRSTGRGDWLDLAEMDCWAAHPNQISRRLLHAYSGDIEPREDTKLAASAAAAGFGRGTYQCLDGYVTFLPLGDRHWPRLVEFVEDPALLEDPRFATREARRDHRADWETIWGAYVGARTVAEIFASAQRAGLPSGPLNDAARLLADPQLEAREFFEDVRDPERGTLRYPGPVAKAGDDMWAPARPAPALGADTRRVLAEDLAMPAGEAEAMARAAADVSAARER